MLNIQKKLLSLEHEVLKAKYDNLLNQLKSDGQIPSDSQKPVIEQTELENSIKNLKHP